MDRSQRDSTLRRRFLNVAAMVTLAGALYACGGGGSSVAANEGTINNQSQFDAYLKASTVYTALTKELSTDEATIAAQQKLLAGLPIPHKPGTSIVTAAADASGSARTEAIPLPGARTSTVTIDYGDCPDGGQYIGSSAPDPSGATTDFFKQCTGVIYGVNTSVTNSNGTHPVATAAIIWFTDSTCGSSGGTAIEFENDGQYNDRTLLGGVAFFSPADGTEMWVAPTAEGVTPGNMTSHSIYASGACTPDTETHVGFTAVANSTDGANGSGVPAAVNPYIL